MWSATGRENRANPSLSEHKDAARYRLSNSLADNTGDVNQRKCEVTETMSSSHHSLR